MKNEPTAESSINLLPPPDLVSVPHFTPSSPVWLLLSVRLSSGSRTTLYLTPSCSFFHPPSSLLSSSWKRQRTGVTLTADRDPTRPTVATERPDAPEVGVVLFIYCLQAWNVEKLFHCRGLFSFFESLNQSAELLLLKQKVVLCTRTCPGVMFQLRSEIKVTNTRACRPNICREHFDTNSFFECRQNIDEPVVEFIEAASIFTP